MKFTDQAKTILATLVLTLVLIFSYLKVKQEREFNPFTLKLKATDEKSITLNQVKENKITLLYFGFLSCPSICPTTLASMSDVFKSLPPEKLEKINFLFVDLDPERDTLVRLKEYAAFFHPKIIPVMLNLEDLLLFTKYFGIAFMKVPLKSQMGYTIDHSTDVIVLSPKGEMLEPIAHGSPKVVVLDRLNKLLNQYFKM